LLYVHSDAVFGVEESLLAAFKLTDDDVWAQELSFWVRSGGSSTTSCWRQSEIENSRPAGELSRRCMLRRALCGVWKSWTSATGT